MKANDDGSVTIYIQHEPPSAELRENWLPAPQKKFSLCTHLRAVGGGGRNLDAARGGAHAMTWFRGAARRGGVSHHRRVLRARRLRGVGPHVPPATRGDDHDAVPHHHQWAAPDPRLRRGGAASAVGRGALADGGVAAGDERDLAFDRRVSHEDVFARHGHGLLLYVPIAGYGYVHYVRTGQASLATAAIALFLGGSYHLWGSKAIHRLRARGKNA
jgi:hypothetical protein